MAVTGARGARLDLPDCRVEFAMQNESNIARRELTNTASATWRNSLPQF